MVTPCGNSEYIHSNLYFFPQKTLSNIFRDTHVFQRTQCRKNGMVEIKFLQPLEDLILVSTARCMTIDKTFRFFNPQFICQ